MIKRNKLLEEKFNKYCKTKENEMNSRFQKATLANNTDNTILFTKTNKVK